MAQFSFCVVLIMVICTIHDIEIMWFENNLRKHGILEFVEICIKRGKV